MQKEIQNNASDFIDGVIYSPSNLVLVLGLMTEDIPASSSQIDPINTIYYEYLNTNPNDKSFVMTIEDYLFRWDPDAFWGTGYNPMLKMIFGNKALRGTLLKRVLGAANLRKAK